MAANLKVALLLYGDGGGVRWILQESQSYNFTLGAFTPVFVLKPNSVIGERATSFCYSAHPGTQYAEQNVIPDRSLS